MSEFSRTAMESAECVLLSNDAWRDIAKGSLIDTGDVYRFETSSFGYPKIIDVPYRHLIAILRSK